jgi:hypothetical protein
MIAGSPRGTAVVCGDGSEDAGAAPARAQAASSPTVASLPFLVQVPPVIISITRHHINGCGELHRATLRTSVEVPTNRTCAVFYGLLDSPEKPIEGHGAL